MIATLTGTLKHVELTSVIIDVNGVGYQVSVPQQLAATLLVGTSFTLHTSLVVRQDAMTLYGFSDHSSRSLFEFLQSATGVGPKVALAALNSFSADEITQAIASGDEKTLSSIPGLGKKTASRLIIELKDKVTVSRIHSNPHSAGWRAQIESALAGLGFSSKQIEDAINYVSELYGASAATTDVSLLLKAALQLRGRE